MIRYSTTDVRMNQLWLMGGNNDDASNSCSHWWMFCHTVCSRQLQSPKKALQHMDISEFITTRGFPQWLFCFSIFLLIRFPYSTGLTQACLSHFWYLLSAHTTPPYYIRCFSLDLTDRSYGEEGREGAGLRRKGKVLITTFCRSDAS